MDKDILDIMAEILMALYEITITLAANGFTSESDVELVTTLQRKVLSLQLVALGNKVRRDNYNG